MINRPKLLRITTVPISLKLLLAGQFSFFQQHGFEVMTASADGEELKELLSAGVTHHVVPMTRTITPVQDIICLLKLIRLIKIYKPDIVHTHTPKAGLLGMLAAWMCGVKIRMHTVAGLPLMETKGIKRTLLKITERITYSCATNVYPNSKGLLKYIREQLSIVNCQLSILGKGSSNGIDSNYFSRTSKLVDAANGIRSRYQIPEDSFVFCFVGRVVKDKGIVELVEAFQKLGNGIEKRLILVGPREEALDPLPDITMSTIKNDPTIILPGFEQDVRPWMTASDVFVFPSYREGFPNVVMQAACLEVPCIVSNINGCNEIIEDQVSGLVVEAKDACALLKAMQFMIMEIEKRKMFAINAREFVTKNFDQQFVWKELLKEYQYHLNLSNPIKN